MRIAIVNDQPTVLETMRRVILTSTKHQVAWVARDGQEAVAGCRRDLPDLVLIDLVMPGMDGVEATRRIMAGTPCAILIVTATSASNAAQVFEAMGAGAIDVVPTPTLGGQGLTAFLEKIETTFRCLAGTTDFKKSAAVPHERTGQIVAIGASAGGPAALSKILSALPRDFPAPIVIIQHIDARFAPGLANWLDDICQLPVRLAREGDRLEAGDVYLAGTNDHLTLRPGGRLGYTKEPASCSYRPSVNVFFESVLQNWRRDVLGVLLTGMGRDGAAGLKQLRDAGHHTIGQDRTTSAVYGMPKAARELGAVAEELPLERIADAITRRVQSANPKKKKLSLP